MQLHPRGRIAVLAATLALVPASSAAAQGSARDTALRHLTENAAALGVERADVAQLAVTSEYRSRHSGVTHVNVNQRHRDLEVFGAHATVNVARDGDVVFVGDSFVRGLRASGGARLDAPAAVEAAARGLGLGRPSDVRVLSRGSGPAQRTRLSRSGVSEAEIPARLGYQPTGDGLRLAWQLVIDNSSEAHLWNATVDAATGELLETDDWTSHDNQEDLEATLSRGTAQSAAFAPPFPVDDGSSYRVFEFPDESANDGPRALVRTPADGLASPFGWHDTNGASGPEFTITQGNNVHAYLDQDRNNAPDFGATDGGPGLDFDFDIEEGEHAQNHRDAAVANLFYANNMIHDLLYRYGFDEVSGNFQANNYGRGGGEGDYVRAEAADGSGTNNANFSTPAADSGSPRMQMYLWPGNQFGPQNQVVVDGAGTFGASWSRFGPAPTDAGLPGRTLVYGGDGCRPSRYPRSLPASWIAVADGVEKRCDHLTRAETAEGLGADALVVAHDAEGNAPVLSGDMSGPPVGIPAVAVTQADGAAIIAAIEGGSATGSVRKNPAHPGIRDGDLENGIVLHEYGHGVSNRLTGGPGVNCLSGEERGSEGWSDFFAIALLLNPALDDPQAPRGLVPWVLFQGSRQSNGLRPRPYSRNMQIQPFTYDSIKSGGWLNGASLSVPHGVGHGWAAVLWDMTWDLIDKHGFNPDVYGAWDTGGNNRAIQYVMDGLKLQGCAPGLVVSRAAIIAAADTLSEGEDTCTLWAAFARRGLGYSAIQGTTSRNDNEEAFDTHPECRRSFEAPIADQPALNSANAGETLPVRFTAPGFGTQDVLATNSPYSRLVDCQTLRTIDPGAEFITPRPFPVATQTPGGSGLSMDSGVFQYPWKTEAGWAGTCRELVLTRADGVQHRAYFRFR